MASARPDPAAVAFVGGGHMAGALIGGLLKAGQAAGSIIVVDPAEAQRERLARMFGVATLAAADPRLGGAALVVWAVKPQSFRAAAAPCAAFVGAALQLSVMAGIRSDAIAAATGSERIVRAMPNTPALIGRGIAGLYARPGVSAEERARAQALLAPTGATLWVEREADLDAVTALSGSGPAYVFYLVEAMIEAAVEMGLDEAQGRMLALATVDGAAALAQQSPLRPAELRAQVTSKGGTTHAAISSLEADQVGAAIVRAVHAARDRAAELGDEFGR
jgi:pyrroline-5-carboxylate reductase